MSHYEKVDCVKSVACATCGRGGEVLSFWLLHLVKTQTTTTALYYVVDGDTTDTISVSHVREVGEDDATVEDLIHTQFLADLTAKYPTIQLP